MPIPTKNCNCAQTNKLITKDDDDFDDYDKTVVHSNFQELFVIEKWMKKFKPQWTMEFLTWEQLGTFSFQRHQWLTNKQQ